MRALVFVFTSMMLASSAAAQSLGSASVFARGASRVSGELELSETGESVIVQGRLRGMTPGPYRVVFMPKCPPEPRPTDLSSGRVNEDRRSGLERVPIPGPTVAGGSFIASDRERAEVEIMVDRERLAGWSRIAVGLLEGDMVNPPLSDRYGLIACTAFVRP